jgi:hypothetical protein
MSKKGKLLTWLLCLAFFFQSEGIISLIPQNKIDVYAETNSLQVQFFNANKAGSIAQVYPQFKITNTGTNAVNFSNIKLRYYYTADSKTIQFFACDWSTLPISAIKGTFVEMPNPQSTADHYLEIGFADYAGSFEPGSSIVIQTRFEKLDKSQYTQTNDYSYNNYATSYVDWNKITAHIGSTLVWGLIPGGSSNIVSSVPSYTNTPAYTPTPRPTTAGSSRSAAQRFQAEAYDSIKSSSIIIERDALIYITAATILRLNNIDFGNGGVSSLSAYVSS